MSQPQSPLENHKSKIETWVSSKGYTINQVVDALTKIGVKTSERSVRRALHRWGVSGNSDTLQPYIKIQGDKAEVVSHIYNDTYTIERIIRDHGLDPEEWQIEKPEFRSQETENGVKKQVKVTLKRIEPYDVIIPARIPSDYKKPEIKKSKLKKKDKDKPKLVVFVGDQQAPFQDQDLHEKFCQWLADYQPDEGVLIGDTIDLPTISRHPDTPELDSSVQKCIDIGYQILRDYVESSESTSWKKLEGNHDYRLRRAVIDNLRDFYGIRRGRGRNEDPENPLLDVEHLLRLDELGIEFVRPNGSWETAQVEVSPHLAARHGWIAKKGSGASALASLEHLGYSIIVGHTHRQSLVYKTKHDINGKPSTITGVETGCMCRIEGGLGYAVAPDWLNGFATAQVWPDGKFKIDLATYVDGVLYYGDKRYE
jgi:predicted phosphodiesterase